MTGKKSAHQMSFKNILPKFKNPNKKYQKKIRHIKKYVEKMKVKKVTNQNLRIPLHFHLQYKSGIFTR